MKKTTQSILYLIFLNRIKGDVLLYYIKFRYSPLKSTLYTKSYPYVQIKRENTLLGICRSYAISMEIQWQPIHLSQDHVKLYQISKQLFLIDNWKLLCEPKCYNFQDNDKLYWTKDMMTITYSSPIKKSPYKSSLTGGNNNVSYFSLSLSLFCKVGW